MKKNLRPQAAFTLLEIMMVVAIIALLLGAAIYKLGPNLGIAKDIRVRGDITSIGTQLNLYQTFNGQYPTTAQGLKSLVSMPDSEPRPKDWHKLMDSLQDDPWGNQYVYLCPGKKNPDGYDLYSAGPDRQPDTADDIWGK